MASLLSSTVNTRAVLPGRMDILRSDALTAPTDADVQWLLDHGITTIIDLRGPRELERHPCPLKDNAHFIYHNLPVTGHNAMPTSTEDVPRSYIVMADAQMTRILDIISRAPGGVIYFCTAGKDRTGVVSALLQHQAGLTREAIVDDYVLSGENLRERLNVYGSLHPEIDPAIYTPQRVYMEAFLDWVEAQA